MNNELYNANAVAKGGIPAVALVAAAPEPESPGPPVVLLLVAAEEAGAFCAAEGDSTAGAEGDLSEDWDGFEEGP